MKQIDRIKSMTTSEMVKFLDSLTDKRICHLCIAKESCLRDIHTGKTCKQTIKDYLESEVTPCESNNTQTE
jgi:hypothetical protein